MLRLILPLAPILAFPAPAPLAADPADMIPARFPLCTSSPRVTCVVDGDTFWLAGDKIRILDINTPETSSPSCDREYALGRQATARLTELLKQPQFSPMPFEEQVVSIFAGTNGYLDSVPVDAVTRYEAAMLADMRANHKDVLDSIRETKALSDETRDKMKAALDAFGKTFA